MAKTIPYDDYLIESLKDLEEAAGYLNASLEDGDLSVVLVAMRNVAKAQGGIAKLAASTQNSRNSIYKTLSENGNPYLKNTKELLNAMGFAISVEIQK